MIREQYYVTDDELLQGQGCAPRILGGDIWSEVYGQQQQA